jgi:Uma2 family endonuclease
VTDLRARFSYADYVALEAESTIKHEFLDGVVYAMSGGTPEHGAIAAQIIGLLSAQLAGKRCRVFTSDVRVRVAATGLGTYPDISVVCGSLELDPEDAKGHTIGNPCLIVEVLSPSTEDYDRGEKLAHYKRIASLSEVVLVAHDAQRIDVWRREGLRWASYGFDTGATAELTSVGCTLAVDDVYRDPLAD